MKAETRSDRLLLEYILFCIGRIRDYTGLNRDTFFGSPLVQDAVMRNLQTVAESTQRLSDKAKSSESGVPWRSIAGFRNVLTHGYMQVDLEVVWSVVEKDLPTLASAVERLHQSIHADSACSRS